jgi:hypothetical protein
VDGHQAAGLDHPEQLAGEESVVVHELAVARAVAHVGGAVAVYEQIPKWRREDREVD